MTVFRYLGVDSTPDGRVRYSAHNMIEPGLAALTAAPLKPQQWLHAQRSVLVPCLNHVAALERTNIGSLHTTDCVIRAYVRWWPNLPHDVAVPFFHAAVQHSGLRIHSLRTTVPLLRRNW